QKARHRMRNTILIVMSDNGDMWGEHRVLGKFVAYDSATRVPMAIRWSKRVHAGSTDHRIALNVDIPVSIAAAARASTDPAEGRNLFASGDRSGFVVEAARARAGGGNGTNVTRPAYCGWRTLRYLWVRYADGTREFYDDVKDPYELTGRHRAAMY